MRFGSSSRGRASASMYMVERKTQNSCQPRGRVTVFHGGRSDLVLAPKVLNLHCMVQLDGPPKESKDTQSRHAVTQQ